MRIETETLQVKMYVDSNGDKTPLKEIHDNHLMAAYTKFIKENGDQHKELSDSDYSTLITLRGEILRRMKKTNDDENNDD